ncbi:acyl carrier protein [Fodinicola feengrottensis]|uniref:Carrier domain-containing protein n=1 Tax=Fodinicola feengrottensis TaxID=435914 RepID=A0ABN2IL48_9ACTN|nr:acyl carrier protein [Fodinicola feengrottensis]
MAAVDVAQCEEFVRTELAELTGEPDTAAAEAFLQLGGDSLRAELLAGAIEERYGISIDTVAILHAGSIRALAELVAAS